MEKQGILVYLECAEGHIIKVSLEAMNAAAKLAAKTGKKVGAVLVNNEAAAAEAAAFGADFVVASEAGEYNPGLTIYCTLMMVTFVLIVIGKVIYALFHND